MFYFAKQKLLIISDNNEYPVTAFYKSLHPNFSSAPPQKNFFYPDMLGEMTGGF